MTLPEVRKPCKCLLTVVLLTILLSPNLAAQRGSGAKDIRTTFVFHIANYMSLPDDFENQRNITFCFIEDAPYTYYNLFTGTGIKQLRGLGVNALSVQKIEDIAGAGCQLAFFSKSKESDALFAALTQLNLEIVTIGETRNFVNRGGIVALVELQSRIRVLINREEYDRTATKFSSLLLRHARFR